jgi:hypothetical protein
VEAGVARNAWPARAGWVAAVAVWLVLAFSPPTMEPVSAQAGQIAGGYFATLLLAAAVRGLYVLVRRRRVPFWSPWLFVIAAVIGLMAKAPQIAENAERSEMAASIEQRSPGDESQPVRECIAGYVARYNEVPEAERQVLTREVHERMAGRICKEAERRGLFAQEQLDQAALTQVVEDVVSEMRDSGELAVTPPA